MDEYVILIVIFRFRELAECYEARFKSLKVDKETELARYRELAEKVTLLNQQKNANVS